MSACIFCKIRDKVIPKDFTYEDDEAMVFPDIHPFKPIHLLIVPKVHIEDFLELKDSKLWNKLRQVSIKMVKEQKLENKGYGLSINGGGAQLINHLHIHLMGPIKSTEEM